PVQIIGGVRHSVCDHHPADKNWDYQCTLDEEQWHHEGQSTVDSEPLPECTESLQQSVEDQDDDHIHFVGIGATGPTEHDLPQLLLEAFAHADGHLW
ncbi:hypothetical protein BDR04DRAFT_991145, partial [Suillus decipiens]